MHKLLSAALLAVSAALPAHADSSFPTRPVQLIVPFNAGGGQDILIRHIAPKLSEILGQQVVVDNKPGAAGSIGARAVADAKPDGYTIGLGSASTHAANVVAVPDLPYDPVADFAPVALISESSAPLVVHGQLPVDTVADLIALLKANPGAYNYGSAGNGSPTRFNAILFNQAVGVTATEVPYSGSAPALVDLVAGRLAYMFDGIAATKPLIESGDLKILAVQSENRLSVFPDVPTLVELGIEGVNATSWSAIFAPKDTPVEIVDKLNAAFAQALRDPALIATLEGLGYSVIGDVSSDDLRAHVASEVEKWKGLSELAGGLN